MIRQITAKLIMIYMLIMVSVFVLLNFFGNRGLERRIIGQKKEVLLKEAGTIATEYGENYMNSSITLKDLRQQLLMTDHFLNVRILLTNSVGRVFADTRSERQFLLTDYLPEFPKGEVLEKFTNTELSEDTLLLVWKPISYDDIIRGYVCLSVSMEAIEQEKLLYMNLLNIIYLVLGGILLLIFVLLFFYTAYPLFHLKRMALSFAKGDFEAPFSKSLRDEYREIGLAISYLGQEVQSLEDYRKNFVANVSHDFRSPLTSIKGYIEAMKDGTIPLEAQEKYFDVILFETERLKKLSESLLALTALENRKRLELTNFDINKVIKRTAAAFEGVCTKKHLVLELVFADTETIVTADIERIRQVLYNLIDNAIKFSNHESTVVVSVEQRSNKAFVSVKDSGIGIPKDSQKHIWERFYKTDLSRGKDKKGTGLGLPIAKEIINAHNESINVISTEGVGSEFVFSLQLAE